MSKLLQKKAYLFIYPMLIIAFIGIVKYVVINIGSIGLAFTIKSNGSNGEQIFTLKNFTTLFAELGASGSGLWQYVVNTLLFFVTYLIKTVLAFFVAYFLYKKIFGYKFFRVIFYLPCLISPIVLVSIWKNLFESIGMIGRLVTDVFQLPYINPLTQSSTAKWLILGYSFWAGFGVSLLVFVGAMNRIPVDIIEAGVIDGCGLGREFYSIILPLAWETLSTMILLTVMGVFTATGPILFFTAGNFDTKTLSFFLFWETYKGEYNYPSAVGIFFTIIALPIVFGSRFIMNKMGSDVEY